MILWGGYIVAWNCVNSWLEVLRFRFTLHAAGPYLFTAQIELGRLTVFQMTNCLTLFLLPARRKFVAL